MVDSTHSAYRRVVKTKEKQHLQLFTLHPSIVLQAAQRAQCLQQLAGFLRLRPLGLGGA
jgi:hypothetical protein